MKRKKQKLEGFDNIRQAAFEHEMRNKVWCKCKVSQPMFTNKSVCRTCQKDIKAYYKSFGLV